MSVIAEGVEKRAQADFLRSIGCNYIQGYLYSRPMPVESYEAHCAGVIKEEKLLTLETVENLDNNAFWDPESLDTLIFNSFVGGACIFEYHDGRIELVRATEKYAQVIGGVGLTVEDALKIDWSEHLDEENYQLVTAAMDESIATGSDVTREFLFLDLPNCTRETYLRSTLRVIAFVGTRYLVYCTNENITAQRQAEQREQRLDDRLSLIMDRMNCGISAMTVDADGVPRMVFANDKYYAILGYTPEQAEAELTDIREVVYEPDKELSRASLCKLISDHIPTELECRCVRRDGSIVHVRSNRSLAYIDGYGGEVVISVVTEITETVLAKEQTQVILDNVGSGVTAITMDGDEVEFLLLNDRLCELLGHTRESYMEAGAFAPIHEDDRQLVIDVVSRVYITGEPATVEYRVCRPDGTLIWLLVSLTMTRFVGVERPVQIGVFNDITAEKKTELRERQNAQEMRLVMENVNSGICASVFSDEGELRILFANDRFYSMYGYTKELMEAEIGSPTNAVHPDDLQRVLAIVRELLQNGGQASYEYRCIRWDGSVITVSSNNSITSFPGIEDKVLLTIITDVTEVMASELRERRMSEQMQAVLRDIHNGISATTSCDGMDVPVFINDRFYEMRGYTKEQYQSEVTGFFDRVHPDDLESVRRASAEALESAQTVELDYRSIRRDGEVRWFRTNMSVTRFSGIEQPVMLRVYTDITEERLREQEIHDSDEQLRFLNDSAHDILSQPDSEKAVRDTLGNILTHFAADRAYVIELNYAKSIADNTYEVCALGISSEMEKLHSMPIELVDDWIEAVNNERYVVIDNVAELNDSRAEMRELLLGQNIHSILIVPMWRDGELVGFAGVDNPTRATEQIAHLAALSDYIAILLTRRDLNREVERGLAEQQLAMERLRISEEEYRLAQEMSGNIICRFVVAEKRLYLSPELAVALGLDEISEDVPYGPVRSGMIASESADAYIEFFEAILRGEKTGGVVFRHRYFGQPGWMEAKSTTIFSDSGEPVKAVIVYFDVTERMEREAIYRKWQQSLAEKHPQAYSLFRINLNNITSYAKAGGELVTFDFEKAGADFNSRAQGYARARVYAEDRERYIAFADSNVLLADYHRGHRSDMLEYRELTPEGGARWLRLTVEMVEYPNSTDVEAYLMYEDVDEEKRAELETKEHAQTDPLTGLLNRATFAALVNHILSVTEPARCHALLMLDIDGFKQVNDSFGHGAGDQALTDIANDLRAIVRRDDLVCRLGGDEFMVFFNNIQSETVALSKAKQICIAIRKALSMEVQISGSVGIAMAPRDGEDFDTLYKKADSALYYVKGSGKDSFVLYDEGMSDEHLEPELDDPALPGAEVQDKRRRMLIVEDNAVTHTMLQTIFNDEFIVEKAVDGNAALIRLRHYGSAISVVLLDLMMPGMDGFAVLSKMQQDQDLRSIPVIIVSGDESRETCLNAVRAGATDFVTKPVDPDILRIRVHSAITKSENEMLRMKNRMLELQNEERLRFENELGNVKIAFIEYSWSDGSFRYHPSVSKYLLGTYDSRSFWRILLDDMVADTQTVQKMQNFVQVAANNRDDEHGSIIVQLKTPGKVVHSFCMSVRMLMNESLPAATVSITLYDMGNSDMYDAHQ